MYTSTHSLRLILGAGALALLVACSVEEPPAASQEASAATQPDRGAESRQAQGQLPDLAPPPARNVPQTEIPAEVGADAVRVGSVLDTQGAATEPKPVYALTDTIHASVPTQGASQGGTLTVYWTFEDGLTHKEETVDVPTSEHASFSFSQADGMQAGLYNVQIDAGFEPIGISEFRVE